jgi:hypothetical protein
MTVKYVHRIERHGLGRVVGIGPRQPDGTAPDATMLDELKAAKAEGHVWFGRMDILLWSSPKKSKCYECGHVHDCYGKQRTVFPGQNGTLKGDVVAAEAELTPEDIKWAKEESAKVWATALAEPLFMEAFFGK